MSERANCYSSTDGEQDIVFSKLDAQLVMSGVDHVGAYTLDKKKPIRRGSFGLVLGAFGIDGSPVALKISNSTKPKRFELFTKETEMHAAVAQATPYVPTLIDSRVERIVIDTEIEGQRMMVDDVFPALMMEYIHGGSLKDFLYQQSGGLGLSRAARLLRPAALALDTVHTLGYAYRDLKPSNILLRNDAEGVLSDFGAVVPLGEDQEKVMGTYGYMSAEQLSGKSEKENDLFALGITALEAITGEHPVPIESRKVAAEYYAFINSVLYEANLYRLTAGLPVDAQDVLIRACSRNPIDRPENGISFIDTLLSTRQESVTVASPSIESTVRESATGGASQIELYSIQTSTRDVIGG